MTGRSSGAQSKFKAEDVREDRACETVGESSRELYRLDKERMEQEAFERLQAELQQAFAAPEESYRSLTAAEVIDRNG